LNIARKFGMVADKAAWLTFFMPCEGAVSAGRDRTGQACEGRAGR
jgi:hypothetical protein